MTTRLIPSGRWSATSTLLVPQSTVMSEMVPAERSVDVAVPATPDAICDCLAWSLSSVPFHWYELMEALSVGTT